MDNIQDSPVGSMINSSDNPAGKSRQPSEQVVALLSSIQIEMPSFETLETVTILMLILEGITAQTVSGDALWLALNQAKIKSKQFGIEPNVVDEVIKKFILFSKKIRCSTPMGF